MDVADSGPLVDQQGKPAVNTNKSSPFYCPTVAGEAVCVSAMLKKYIYPKLHPHQQAFVVPGLFGSKPGDPAEDAALVAKFEGYWAMATADERIVGLNPWYKPHDYCWHLGCILPRVPAMIVRTGTTTGTSPRRPRRGCSSTTRVRSSTRG